MRELAIIKTRTTGQCFGTVGLVIVKGKLVHTTDVRPFGFDSSANSDAEEWADWSYCRMLFESFLQKIAHNRPLPARGVLKVFI